MDQPLIFSIPSKGRLKEQVEAWLGDCGFRLVQSGGARGYSASLDGVADLQVRLSSASDIAAALEAGDIHLGVTGEDLLRERSSPLDTYGLILAGLGFGRADLVVAVPEAWIDVQTMSDLDDVAHAQLAATGRRLRVATKYLVQTRGFFQQHGLVDYRVVESSGATEGAPAAGLAEVVVDITTTGATLADNGLKILADGLILKSEANLAASLRAGWTPDHLATAGHLLQRLDARAQARTHSRLNWPSDCGQRALNALSGLLVTAEPSGAVIRSSNLPQAIQRLTQAGVDSFSGSKAELIVAGEAAAFMNLKARLTIIDN